MGRERTGLQSVGRALDVLEAMAAAQGEMGVRELAERLDMKVTTTWDVIATLVARGYLVKDERTGRCRVGSKCLALAGAAMRCGGLPEAGMATLEELSGRLGESASLALWRGERISWGAETEGSRAVVARPERATEFIGFSTACGLAILASVPPPVCERYLARYPLNARTAPVFHTEEHFREEMVRARQSGYAVVERPERDAASAAAWVIRDHTGAVAGAVGVAVPNARFHGAHRLECITAVREAAEAISARLGHTSIREEGA